VYGQRILFVCNEGSPPRDGEMASFKIPKLDHALKPELGFR
jgi:hypothetical protein